jgi:hypothetical protein
LESIQNKVLRLDTDDVKLNIIKLCHVFFLQGAASTHMQLYVDYKMPTSMKLGMETDLNVPAVVFMVYVSLRGFPSAFLFSNFRRLYSVHCLAKD